MYTNTCTSVYLDKCKVVSLVGVYTNMCKKKKNAHHAGIVFRGIGKWSLKVFFFDQRSLEGRKLTYHFENLTIVFFSSKL